MKIRGDRLEQVNAVIFDMDGLMFDSETLYYQANQEIASRLGLEFTYEYYAQYIGLSDEEFHRNLYTDYQDTAKVDALISGSRDYLLELIEKEGLILKPGLIELLEFLEQKKIRKVVASSSQKKTVQLFLQRESLLERFDTIIGGDEVRHAKPHPEIFEKAWLTLGVPKERCLVLEDSLNGIRAAYSADLPVIMVPDLYPPNDEAKEKTVAIKNNLFDVLEWIRPVSEPI